MSKPKWEDAPDWASYLAMDFDGQWYWYEKKPSLDIESCFYWAKGGGEYEEASMKCEHPWDKAPILEIRP